MQRNLAPLVIEQTTSSSTRVASRHLLDPASQARPVLANARISLTQLRHSQQCGISDILHPCSRNESASSGYERRQPHEMGSATGAIHLPRDLFLQTPTIYFNRYGAISHLLWRCASSAPNFHSSENLPYQAIRSVALTVIRVTVRYRTGPSSMADPRQGRQDGCLVLSALRQSHPQEVHHRPDLSGHESTARVDEPRSGVERGRRRPMFGQHVDEFAASDRVLDEPVR